MLFDIRRRFRAVFKVLKTDRYDSSNIIVIIMKPIDLPFLYDLYYLFLRLVLTSTNEEYTYMAGETETGKNTRQGSYIMLQKFLLHKLYYTLWQYLHSFEP